MNSKASITTTNTQKRFETPRTTITIKIPLPSKLSK